MAEVSPDKCAACPSGPPPLKYTCNDCGHEFVLPSPRGPAEEQQYACPKCKSRNLKRAEFVSTEFCVPGG